MLYEFKAFDLSYWTVLIDLFLDKYSLNVDMRPYG